MAATLTRVEAGTAPAGVAAPLSAFVGDDGQELVQLPDGIAGYVPDASEPGAKPIYAFRGRLDNFYTPDPQNERIRPRLLRPEGVAFHVLAEARDGAVPLYRFFDERRGLHFYTTHPHAEFAK